MSARSHRMSLTLNHATGVFAQKQGQDREERKGAGVAHGIGGAVPSRIRSRPDLTVFEHRAR